MKKLRPLLLLLLTYFIISCDDKEIISSEELYLKLPSLEYISNTYSVNGAYLNKKTIFKAPNLEIPEGPHLIIEYNNQEIAGISYTDSSSVITILTADTDIGDICSIFESERDDNKYLFINGEEVAVKDGQYVVDFKIYNNNFFLALSNDLGEINYKIYR